MDRDKIAGIVVISLNRFSEGGAAILVAEARNHISAIGGAKAIRPLAKNKARVLNIS